MAEYNKLDRERLVDGGFFNRIADAQRQFVERFACERDANDGRWYITDLWGIF